eukprot:NODE_1227_length_1228_cov_12.977099_g1000_i0.p2 GENE.NODE_1227_length_1228_cov_12.977099_g1000_i0~~NODE_1227_length_1228_cov_12.977099_g1000_i0.p2  ORF type:complete len:190 (-),score=58.18 NODE_1227_length_1228_cov_12.977099_g1000_i0:45-614(-)
MIHETVGIYVFNLADIFLGGLNPATDLLMQAGNLMIYKKAAKKLFKANGIIPFKPSLMNHEAGHMVTEEQLALMVGGVIAFGQGIYGVETLAAAYPICQAFKDNGISGVNSLIFSSLDYSTTAFSQTINGNLSFNSDFYKGVEFYFYLHAAVMEITALVMLGIYDSKRIITWWPRTANSVWDLTQTMLM